jgi:hypothetical protein
MKKSRRSAGGHGSTSGVAFPARPRAQLECVYRPRQSSALVELWGREGVFMGGHRLFSVTYPSWMGAWSRAAVEQEVASVLPPGTLWYGCLRQHFEHGRLVRLVHLLLDVAPVRQRLTFMLGPSLFRVGESQAVVGGLGRNIPRGSGGRSRLQSGVLSAAAFQHRFVCGNNVVAIFGRPIVMWRRCTLEVPARDCQPAESTKATGGPVSGTRRTLCGTKGNGYCRASRT